MLPLLLFFSMTFSASAAIHDEGQFLMAIGMVYQKPVFLPIGPAIPTIGNLATAFRTKPKSGEPVWLTAAHTVETGFPRLSFFIAPAWQQYEGYFKPFTIQHRPGKIVTNFDEVDPKLFFSFDGTEIQSESKLRISLPFISRGNLPGGGSDLVVVKNVNGNFADVGFLSLRSLQESPLDPEETVFASGYAYNAVGYLQTLKCKFKGYGILNGGFRGFAFCKTPSAWVQGMSGGPITDEAGRVLAVMSSQNIIHYPFDTDGNNTVIHFTPIIEREDGRLDGLNSNEIAKFDCVRFVYSEMKGSIAPEGKCAPPSTN